MKRNENGKSPASVICSALGTALLTILILVCIPLTVPRFFHYQVYTVVSGSMEPAIPTGSLVYVKSVEPETVQAEDVIAFYGSRDTDAVITHRVVENRVDTGEFITKGDANRTEDMNPVEYDHFIGRVELTVSKLGAIAQILTGAEGKIAAGCMIGLAVILHLLATVFDRQ